MGRTGTDLMATGVIVGSTALAVAATLAFTRANPLETQDSMVKCTPHDAHWSVMYAVTVDGDAVKSKPAKWHLHTGLHVPQASHEATRRCRHLTLVTPQATVTAKRLTLELGEAADQVAEAAERAESAKEQAEALRNRLEAIKELAEEKRLLREAVMEQRLREAVEKQIEADRARER
ncbi:MAG: hypothetical protein OXU74_03960 [Gemmatimonadota bacterium]|nr:hypothetical protein [Gemmatimonadota bacterium]